MRKLFADLKSANGFAGLGAANFAVKAAKFVNELNAIHPFVEGNGRANRAFLQIMAARAGHELDLALIVPKAWNAASVDGFEHGADTAMIDIITAAVVGPYRASPSPPLKDDFGVDPPSRKAPTKRLLVRGKSRDGR